MLMRRNFLTAAVITAAVAMFRPMVFPALAQGDSSALETFINSLSEKAITELQSAGTDKERAARLLPILRQYFDMQKLAKHTLGAYWKRATPAEQAEYVAVFTEYMSAVYGKRFAEYSGQKLAVQRIRAQGDLSTVFTIVKGAEGEPRVDWDVNTKGDRNMITDVRIEGLSLAETHRQEFASVISSHGGKISALIDILKKKVASI